MCLSWPIAAPGDVARGDVGGIETFDFNASLAAGNDVALVDFEDVPCGGDTGLDPRAGDGNVGVAWVVPTLEDVAPLGGLVLEGLIVLDDSWIHGF